MAIRSVDISDFLVFKGKFSTKYCSGINILIGGNGTGKTTLLKVMYGILNRKVENCFYSSEHKNSAAFGEGIVRLVFDNESTTEFQQGRYNETAGSIVDPSTGKIITFESGVSTYVATGKPKEATKEPSSVYIPEKDMLSHSLGFLALKHERPSIPFDDTLTDIIAKAQLYPKKEMFNNPLCTQIRAIIGGEVAFDNDSFIVLKDNGGTQVPFPMEASGYRKLGLLWKLIRNGLLETGSILFWDEPENSLNPELIPVLVDILLELSRNGVQIFIATHSEILASYFAVNSRNNDIVLFTSLYKDGELIKANTDNRFDLLEPNNLTAEPVKLYEKEIEKGLGGNG